MSMMAEITSVINDLNKNKAGKCARSQSILQRLSLCEADTVQESHDEEQVSPRESNMLNGLEDVSGYCRRQCNNKLTIVTKAR